MTELAEAVQRLDVHLGARRRAAAPSPGWRGELSSSALSTATAMMALHGVDAAVHEERIQKGARWLLRTQNADGGWGDTEVSRSNLSTTLLVWASLHRCAAAMSEAAQQRAADWVRQRAGGSGPNEVAAAVVARYGKDRTFSVPILMHCTLGGILGEARSAWRRVLALPFELAALPRAWFGRLSLPVVSYALPALIAIGYARFHQAPPAWWNPLRWLRAALWPRIRPLLAELQPSSGGYLEATPLTSFVTMALAAAGQKDHPCVAPAVAFLLASMRENPADPDAGASWPIDTDLATWATTLSIKAGVTLQEDEATAVRDWLLDQQYAEVHPFTMAAPGGWAWTELPGGVPDADDTPGAMLALHRLDADLPRVREAAARGARWLLDLQNRDGGMPTFCRGWGTLPFDRSTPELTAHALAAWWCWRASFDDDLRHRVDAATSRALVYLHRVWGCEGTWIPLWFGNEATADEENPVFGTARVVDYLSEVPELAAQARDLIDGGVNALVARQSADGGWGGDGTVEPSVEETAVVVIALCKAARQGSDVPKDVVRRGLRWLLNATDGGRQFSPRPIGLYFARLWYFEVMYPEIWCLEALKRGELFWADGAG